MTLSPRGRRWLISLSVLGLLLALAGWWVNRQLEPNRLATTVLGQLGKSLQLQFSFSGNPEYALKPEPRLLLPGLEVRGLDGKPFLTARRAEISLPWATITGGEAVITRIELEGAWLDLPGLRRWQATQPAKPFELPTLSDGLRVSDGKVVDDGYALEALSLDLPRLKTGETAQLAVQGRLLQGDSTLAFKADISAATPGPKSAFTLVGSGELQHSPKPLVFATKLGGAYAWTDDGFFIDAPTFSFEGAGDLPKLQGTAAFISASDMRISFDGALREWPATWPALPKPFDANLANLPIVLSYVGKSDLSDQLRLAMDRAPTHLQASLNIAEVQAWVSATAPSLLPPLDATLVTPSIEFDGVLLEGVEVQVSRGAAPE